MVMTTKPHFIAEFTTNHMGNLNVLLRMVEQAARAGCSFIKMQKKEVESFYSAEKLDTPFKSPYGKTYRDYRTLFEFNDDDFERFDRHCKRHGVSWYASVQDIPSLYFLLKYDLPLYKVASCNARNTPFLQELADNIPHDKTIVVSVAGCDQRQIEDTLNIYHRHNVWLQHCVAQYPCPPTALRLGNIRMLIDRFASDKVTIGYSGHEEGIAASFAAIDQGARIIERHFCLSRYSFVHHIECSLEPDEFKQLVDTVHSDQPLAPLYAMLPSAAFDVQFEMTDSERSFLVDQTYGKKYIGNSSAFAPADANAATADTPELGLGSVPPNSESEPPQPTPSN